MIGSWEDGLLKARNHNHRPGSSRIVGPLRAAERRSNAFHARRSANSMEIGERHWLDS